MSSICDAGVSDEKRPHEIARKTSLVFGERLTQPAHEFSRPPQGKRNRKPQHISASKH
jgi:hypothetical protein